MMSSKLQEMQQELISKDSLIEKAKINNAEITREMCEAMNSSAKD